jgi:hypothetical protein
MATARGTSGIMHIIGVQIPSMLVTVFTQGPHWHNLCISTVEESWYCFPHQVLGLEGRGRYI